MQDERYSWREVAPAAQIGATHGYYGERHPIAWKLEREGGRRTVYYAASYSSAGHRRSLETALDWIEG